jgi:hypothetical protein
MLGPRMIALVLCAALLGAACESDGGDGDLVRRMPVATPTGSDPLVIGLVGTISGRGAWRGEDAFEGADLAVNELNRALSPGARHFELVTLDDQGDASRARELVERLARTPSTVGIVYAGPPESLPDTEDALADAGIPAVTCYDDLYGARLLTPHLFQMAPSLVWEARRIAAYVLRDRGYRRVGLIASRSVTGGSAVAALNSAVTDAGGAAPATARYGSAAGIRDGLERLRKRRVEALVIQGSPSDLDRVVEEVADMNSQYRSTRYARIASAPSALRTIRRRSGWWHPQIVGFDLSISPLIPHTPPPGTVAADSYARGAHYFPIPNLQDFRTAFVDWWGILPFGWQQRAYDAARMIGWAHDHRRGSEDLAVALERMRGVRFGGLDITLGPDDHTAVTQTTVGLWVIPRSGIDVAERDRVPASLPWVPLARGFSIDGTRTDVLPQDWKYLFTKPPPQTGRAPKFSRSRMGVTTTRSDPVH